MTLSRRFQHGYLTNQEPAMQVTFPYSPPTRIWNIWIGLGFLAIRVPAHLYDTSSPDCVGNFFDICDENLELLCFLRYVKQTNVFHIISENFKYYFPSCLKNCFYGMDWTDSTDWKQNESIWSYHAILLCKFEGTIAPTILSHTTHSSLNISSQHITWP